MALSQELKRMVSGADFDPLEAKRAEILARLEEAEREVGEYEPSIRERLAWLGLQKATKQELREIIVKSMERDPDA
ncbi:hypothetical protein [Ensifer sp. OV372]|uniref:hypothetical protein n=1 Tax=Ensifer sp. OV372 TaxID=1855293 RepID=UPI0008E28863|nr:hypothetical protein [Ensifer sp. OV372]SFH22900.1 hypothetical protein SAMN05216459_1214 [Ensifer sp. OV372]